MFAMGFVLVLAMMLLFWKLSWRTRLRLLNYPLAIDIGITVLMTLVHWGTLTGLMAAAFAGLLCSCVTSGGRYLFGYIKGSKYYPGRIPVQI